MARLSLSLLGPFQVTLDGAPITRFESDKVRALLAYLAVEADRPHRRQTLVGLLWPDWPEGAARRNLSHALANLRRAIGDDDATPPFLLITPQMIQFNRASDYSLDVEEFEWRVANSEWRVANSEWRIANSAINLYRGSFLEGFSLKDSPAFDDWVLLARERLQRQALAALRHLAQHHEGRGEVELACGYAWRQVELEPWEEEAHRGLMRLLALSGQRSAALAQYEVCRRRLREELGVEPGPETTALYERIRDGVLGRGAREQGGRGETFPLAPSPLRSPAPPLPLSPAPFVARERELARLDGYLDQALAGQGRVVFVTGGPGRGKTALLGAFARRAQAAHADLVVAGGNGNAHTGIGDPYLPFRDILGMLTGDVEARWAAGAIGREQAERLWQLVPHAAQVLLDAGPGLVDTFVSGAALLARATACAPDRPDWLARLERLVERHALRQAQGAVGVQQSDLFEQYTRLLHALARRGPLVLLADDLQWADAGSISLLFHLGRRLAGGRILLVGAYRPEEVALGRDGGRHPLEPVVHEFQRDLGEIEIDLAQTGDRQFVDALLDAEPNRLSAGFRETLYRQTGGHPLFTVELLRGMQERGDLIQDESGCWVEGPALDWDRLPARVEAVIAERVGRLPGELRALLAAASVEGEEFTAEAVARVLGADEGEVVRRLSGELSKQHRLVVARSLRRRDGQTLSGYRFRHYLFQKYLYQSLDAVERARLHEALGVALEALYGAGSAEVAVQLAHHFEAAGLVTKAVDYLLLAGNRAVQLLANEEALAHYRRGLELLKGLPESPGRTERELHFQIVLGTPLKITQGVTVPELKQFYARAHELCQQVGGTFELFWALEGLSRHCLLQGELRTAREQVGQALELAQLQNDPYLLSVAHSIVAAVSLWLGELAAFREHMEQSLAFCHPRRDHTLAFAIDPEVSTLAHAALAFWCLGYPDQAVHWSQEALAWAQELAHPPVLGQALFLAAELRRLRQEVGMARELAEAEVTLADEQELPFWWACGMGVRGWALVAGGQPDEGVAQINRGLDRVRANEVWLLYLRFLCLLADACRMAGRTSQGLAVVDEGLALTRKMDSAIHEPELCQLKGELLRQRGGSEAEAEACFWQAIESARRQQARSWELRAAMSLARLWHSLRSPGKREEARHLLAEVYGWFTEGFDTADLREARQLLEALG